MEQKGTVHHIGATENVGDKGFYKRTLVIAFKDGSYDKFLAIEFAKDKGDKLNDLQIGQEVTVSFNLASREWNGKWFTGCDGWKINGAAQPTYGGTLPESDPHHPAQGKDPLEQPYNNPVGGGAADDLPF